MSMRWSHRIGLVLALLAAPWLVACQNTRAGTSATATENATPGNATGGGAALASEPIEPILERPLAISDLAAHTATLKVATRRDVACVVVFGTDATFGQIAFDQQMGNSAHRDHLVVMRGLTPDTEYVYRLQGSAPDGTFFASDTLRFRTPPAAAQADLGANVARAALGARIVDVSSNFGGGDNASSFGANNAIDGDDGTEWSSAGDGNRAFITVELPLAVEVSGFGLWTRTMGASAQIGRFEVETEAGEIFGPFAISDANQLYGFPATGRGQRFTFRVLESSGGNTGVVEIGVFTRDRQ